MMEEENLNLDLDVGNPGDLKLLQIIKEQNEKIQKLTTLLDDKDILISSLEKKICGLENSASNVVNENVDFCDSKDETIKKNTMEENHQVNQPGSCDDPEVSKKALLKGLSNPILVTFLLKRMRTRDLLQNCRLVSRNWRDLSTHVLLKRENLQVGFNGGKDDSSSEFIWGTEENSSSKPNLQKIYLKQLSSLFTAFKTSTFPCANFVFKGSLKRDDAQAFLSTFGNSRIRGLTLIGSQDLSTLRKLFIEQVSKLEHLELISVKADNNPSSSSSSSLSMLFPKDSDSLAPAPTTIFASLTSLKLDNDNSSALVKEIIAAAPNLEAVVGLRSMDEIESLLPHRTHILEGLNLAPISIPTEDCLWDLKRLTSKMETQHQNLRPLQRNLQRHLQLQPELQLQLTFLELSHNHLSQRDYARFDEIISKILRANQTSLKEIKMAFPWESSSLIHWPKLGLKKVVKLTLLGDTGSKLNLNFPSFDLSKIFPNLETVHLGDIEMIKEDLGRFSGLKKETPAAPPCGSVKHLTIAGYCSRRMDLFAPIFPNLTNLKLEKFTYFIQAAPMMWQLKMLKHLQISFYYSRTSEVDAAFTGMEKITCQFLRTAGRGKIGVEEIDKFRVQPSILNLTELESLILLDGFRDEFDKDEIFDDEDEDEFGGPSVVSFQYAFKILPKLRVYSHEI